MDNDKKIFSKAKSFVEIKAVTWGKDSHGLFDYENSYYDMKKFKISNNNTIYRIQNQVECLSPEDPKHHYENIENLLSVCKQKTGKEKFFIEVPGSFQNGDTSVKPTYLIVRSLKQKDGRSQKGYSLKIGDIIKMGRIEYRVTEIQTQTNNY